MSSAPIRDTHLDLSVVVPTYNRCERLMRVLCALDSQHTVTGGGAQRPFSFEVIVVSDGSTDATRPAVEAYDPSYPLTFVEQPNAGPAAARNRGIERASAPIVVFIDDDVVPEPGCLAAHLARHDAHGSPHGLVVIGPMLTPPDVELSPWVAWEQHQLEKQYRNFEAGGEAHHRQFYTGNASVPTAALRRVGGFDTSYRRLEDVELSHRLHLDGLAFAFEPDARAFHHAERSFESWQHVAEDYGHNDVLFALGGRSESFGYLRGFFSERHLVQRVSVRLLVGRPRLNALAIRVLERTSIAAARSGLTALARHLLSGLYNLRYYAGAAEELGGAAEFARVIDGETRSERFVPWFVLERILGHLTHARNLEAVVPSVEHAQPVFLPLEYESSGPLRHVPGWSNWTIRSGIRARRALARAMRDGWTPRPDALFVHSHVPAVMLGRWMRRIPTVVSLDATPRQFDRLGEFYRHDVGSGPMERVKKVANERCYARSAHIVTWSEWARQGLIEDYRVDGSKITVIAPGVDVDRWSRPPGHERPEGPARVLFVGADLERKGGHLLVEAARRLRSDAAVPDFEVHLVTSSVTEPEPGVVVHRGLTANSEGLVEQYHQADIFCLPTYGDCLPMVLAEAGAAGVPLVATDVGAISEIVIDGVTGRLVDPGDVDALTAALHDLLTDGALRERCGRSAHDLVTAEHDARRNARRLVDVLQLAARTPD